MHSEKATLKIKKTVSEHESDSKDVQNEEKLPSFIMPIESSKV